MTKRINFTNRQKRAVREMFDHVCSECGKPANHVDHIQPASKGGNADYANAQLLCEQCNLKFSNKIKKESSSFKVDKPKLDRSALHDWQREALSAQLSAVSEDEKTFFVSAGVGSGKTRQALSFYVESHFDMAIIIVPKTGIRGSWTDDAKEMGLNIEEVIEGSKRVNRTYGLPNGYVMTAPMAQSFLSEIAFLSRKLKLMVILDEAHHLGEGMAWQQSASAIADHSDFILALSGTPDRTDSNKIMALNYKAQNREFVGHPQYIFNEGQALAQKLVAPIVTRFMGGSVAVHHNGSAKLAEIFDYSDGDYSHLRDANPREMMGKRLRYSAVESTDWQHSFIANARKDLLSLKEREGVSWGALVGCYTIEQAKSIKKHIESTYGDKCLLDS